MLCKQTVNKIFLTLPCRSHAVMYQPCIIQKNRSFLYIVHVDRKRGGLKIIKIIKHVTENILLIRSRSMHIAHA